MNLLFSIDTSPNPKGICALCPGDNSLLIYPASAEKGDVVVFDALSLKILHIIQAHGTPVSKLTINSTGTMFASASEKGTVIRVFSLLDISKSWQYRRGSLPAVVFSIRFSWDSTLLCASSETGSIHIFKIETNPVPEVSSSSSSVVTGYIPTFLSDMWEKMPSRSHLLAKLSKPIDHVCGFSPNSEYLYVVTADAILYEFKLTNPNQNGEVSLSKETKLIDV